jgi:hypothetical protein
MKIIIGYNGRGKTPGDKLIEFSEDPNGTVTLWTNEGRILWVHGSRRKKDVYHVLRKMKNDINFSNIKYILTCFPKYMKKFIKEEKINIKESKILFQNYKKITSTSFLWLDNNTLIAGLGKGQSHAKKERKRAIRYYEIINKVKLVDRGEEEK